VIRINLLPPEIGQKRRDEKRWRWVILGAVLMAVVLVGIFAVMQVQVSYKQNEVASVKQQAEALAQSAARFQVFQQKAGDLENRKSIAAIALAGRMDWSKLYSELALVLPTDIYVTRLGSTEPKAAVGTAAAQPGRLSMDGRALDFPNDVPDLGYKSVAKMLVRLAQLDQIDSVWLASSAKPAMAAPTQVSSGEDGAAIAPASTDYYITFSLATNISLPGTSTASATGVPAPPTP
jgi:Tfp pilus assembly protein PilN